MLRSPHAHARFRFTDLETARAIKGVKLILTGADVAEYGHLPMLAPIKNDDGTAITVPPYPVLPTDTVRHIGEAVAFIVADKEATARDAAEAIGIEYDTLPVVTTIGDALKDKAPQVWPSIGAVGGVYTVGAPDKTKAAFAKAARTVSLSVINNRIVTNYMETRAAIGQYDAKTKSFTLTLGSQGSHGIRDNIAQNILKISPDKLRVITPHVGGGFGTKSFLFREYPLVLIAARLLKKTVAWVQERSEHFVACAQGRDNVTTATAALDKSGKIIGLDIDIKADMGAYLSQYSAIIPWFGALMSGGVYAIPAITAKVTLVYTNTVPTDAYRGAGRPEAAYLIERLIDTIAYETGKTPAQVRRKNFITPQQMPWPAMPMRTYDSGEFDGHLTLALERADAKGFPARLKEAKKRGVLRGLGHASYIEACGGGGPENAWITLEKDGNVTVKVGTQTNGQGHLTAYAQLVSQYLDLPLDKITVLQGDTAVVPSGSGTGGSRSLPVGGAAVDTATRTLVDRMKALAATELEASAADLEIADGRIRIAGTDRQIDFARVAALDTAGTLAEINGNWKPPEATYPNGTHAVELEVDPDTGVITIVNYVIVDDFGVTLNPLLLVGQVHGGVVQSIGQAFMERTVYDAESGQLLTASFMDYAVPRASDSPFMNFETRNVRCVTNLLGIKGAGEAGTIGATPAVMNALVDALHRAYGITHIDMPATPLVVWEAIQKAKKGKAA